MDNRSPDLAIEVEVNERLQQGVVDRAGTLCLYLAAAYTIYGLTSISFIHHFDPSVSIYENVFYRMVFNSLPSLLLGLYLKKRQSNPTFKSWVWVYLSPLIFAGACLVYVWPIMFKGHAEIYFYVHAANVMYINLSCMLVSPSTKQIIHMLSILAISFCVPVVIMLLNNSDVSSRHILDLFVGDMILFFALSGFCGYTSFNLRRKLIRESLDLDRTLKELKNAQAILIQSAKDSTLGTFSAGIAHELLNILASIESSLPNLEKRIEYIDDPEKKAKAKESLQRMETSINLAVEICNGFRIYSGNNKYKFREVNVKKVINSVCTMLNYRITAHHIHVSLNIDNSISLQANEAGLHQALLNLFSNSIDAMKNGGSINVSSTVDTKQCMIEISDTGTGIPPELGNSIYDPFFTTKDVGKGTGLGLSIVKGIISNHKGTISHTSVVGKGTTFNITIPLKPNDSEERL